MRRAVLARALRGWGNHQQSERAFTSSAAAAQSAAPQPAPDTIEVGLWPAAGPGEPQRSTRRC